MGRLEFYQYQRSTVDEENVLAKRNFSMNDQDLAKIYDLFLNMDLFKSDIACYIYGFGSQPKSVYRGLRQNSKDEYNVVWYGFAGPRKLKLLSYITASCSGLIKVENASSIKSLMQVLSHLAMVGIFFLSKDFAPVFERKIIDNLNDLSKPPELFAREDKSFAYFIIDGDTYDDEGFLCENAFGVECPDILINIMNR